MKTEYTARSRQHPGERSRAYVFSTRLAKPLAVCMLPVMIGSLLAMLEGQPALYFLYAGFPLAVVVASAWTSIQLRREVVEIHIRSDGVSIRSALAAATPPEVLSWRRLLDVERNGDKISLTVGHDLYVLFRSEWPDVSLLEERLRQLTEPVARRLDIE